MHHCIDPNVTRGSQLRMALGVVDLELDSRLHPENYSGSSHTKDLKIGTPVATLPGAWCCRVSAGTGWPGVSIL